MFLRKCCRKAHSPFLLVASTSENKSDSEAKRGEAACVLGDILDPLTQPKTNSTPGLAIIQDKKKSISYLNPFALGSCHEVKPIVGIWHFLFFLYNEGDGGIWETTGIFLQQGKISNGDPGILLTGLVLHPHCTRKQKSVFWPIS